MIQMDNKRASITADFCISMTASLLSPAEVIHDYKKLSGTKRRDIYRTISPIATPSNGKKYSQLEMITEMHYWAAKLSVNPAVALFTYAATLVNM